MKVIGGQHTNEKQLMVHTEGDTFDEPDVELLDEPVFGLTVAGQLE